MNRLVACSCLATLLLLGGCGEGETPEVIVASTERDSAGITIVDNVLRAIPEGWSVDSEPVWAMGGLNAPDDQQLFRLAGARRLADGRIVLANGGSGEIRVYGADRTLLATFGGKGDGPGEFQDPRLLDVDGDSAFVYDQQHQRISVLHVSDGFARSYPIDWNGSGFPVARGRLANGSITIGGGMSFGGSGGLPEGLIRPESTFGWVGPDGQSETHLADLVAAEMFARVSDQGFVARGLPFSRVAAAGTARDGVWLAPADSYEARFYGAAGTLERILRLDVDPRPTDAAMVAEWIESQVESDAQSEERRTELRQQASEMPIPKTLPPLQKLMVDQGGDLWIEDYLAPGEDDPTWTVFSATGHVLGRLRVPARTDLVDVGEDYVLGRTLDDFDVESLTLWTLRRPND